MRFADERLQELFTKCLNKWGQYLHDTDFEDLSALETFERELKYCELEDAFILAAESAIRREAEPCEWEKQNAFENKEIPRWYVCDYGANTFTPNFCPMCGRKLEAK